MEEYHVLIVSAKLSNVLRVPTPKRLSLDYKYFAKGLVLLSFKMAFYTNT